MEHINEKRRGHGRFYCLLALLLGLIALRYAFQIDIPPMIFVAVIVVIALLGDRDEIIAMCICCIPLHESIDLFYAVALTLIIYILKFLREIRLNPAIFPVIAMVLWELVHCFRADFSIVKYISDCIPLLMLAIFLCLDVRKIDYCFVSRAFAVATAALCASLLVKLLYLTDFNFLAAFSGLQRLGNDAAETTLDGKGTMNPNTLGIICVLATTGLMQLRTAEAGTKQDMVLAVFLMVFGALTSSRTYLVCLALMVVLLLFSQKGPVEKKLRFLGGMILVILVALGLLYLIFPSLMEYYISRFQVKDITTGRDTLLIDYNEFILSSAEVMGFGIGLHDFQNELLNVYRVTSHVPHNGIQELVIAWGFPGLILFAMLFASMIQRAGRRHLLNYIPLIILLAKVQAGQMLNSSYTMLAFSHAYLSMCQDFTPAGDGQELRER